MFYPYVSENALNYVSEVIKSRWIGQGPKVNGFEKKANEIIKAPYAVAVNSSASAIRLALAIAGVGPYDEVITTAQTCTATNHPILEQFARPVFADIQYLTGNMDPKDIERRITPKTKAILPVHWAGYPCDMDEIHEIAKKHKLKVIEDCAHSVETKYKGEKTGTFGDIGCFSFYVTKNMVTAEGGMVITNNKKYAEDMRILSLHGMSADAWKRYGSEGYKHYEVVEAGYKYNMTDIQASLGIHQLARVDKNWKRREKIWKRYMKELAGLPLILPAPVEKGTRHAYHLFTILIDTNKTNITRDQFLNEMTKRNIGTGVHFRALHLQPYYRKTLGCKKGDSPNVEWIGDRTVSIPLSAKLSDRDVNDVIQAIRSILA